MKTGRYERETKTEAWLANWIRDKPDYLQDFMSCLQGVEYTTKKEYMEQVWRYLKWLQDHNLDVYNIETLKEKPMIYINRYLSYLKSGVPGKEKEITGSYRAVTWTALNKFYEFLINCYDFPQNPMKQVSRPNSTKDKVDKDVLNEAEIQQIIINIKETNIPNKGKWNYHHQMMARDLFMFLLLIDTGARISGILEMNLEDVDLEKNIVTITSKGHITRDYYISNDTAEWCAKWLQVRKGFLREFNNRALFINNQGKRWNYYGVRNMLKQYSFNIEEHVTPHTTRRTVATLLYEETHDIELVKDKLGHASVSTTSRYIKKDDEHIRRANAIGADIISRALN